MPRLELAAAVEAVKLDKMLTNELQIPLCESVFWTDSTIVLWYLNNTMKRFQTFVANRVSAIQQASSPSKWRYVDTRNNPADDVSRGQTATELLSNKDGSMTQIFCGKIALNGLYNQYCQIQC